jgi:hypothetical protein
MAGSGFTINKNGNGIILTDVKQRTGVVHTSRITA